MELELEALDFDADADDDTDEITTEDDDLTTDDAAVELELPDPKLLIPEEGEPNDEDVDVGIKPILEVIVIIPSLKTV